MKTRIGRLLALFLFLVTACHAQTNVPIVNGVATADVGQATKFKITVNAIVQLVLSSSTTPAPYPGETVNVVFTENSTGGFAVTFAANIGSGCTVNTPANATTQCSFTYDATANAWNVGGGSGGGISSVSSLPGIGSSVIAEYKMLSTENPCALVDYSGHGNNATGCVGTSPTIVATTGGVNFLNNGAIQLPSVLNSAQTIMLYVQHPFNIIGHNAQLIAGSVPATSTALVLQHGQSNLDFQGAIATYKNGVICDASNMQQVIGTGLVAYTLGATKDHININGQDAPDAVNGCTSQGAQTAGVFQLGGTTSNFYYGNMYYAVFFNRVLASSELLAAYQFIVSAVGQRGISAPTMGVGTDFAGNTYLGDTFYAIGDSITVGFNGLTPYTAVMNLATAPAMISNGGVTGSPVGTQNGANNNRCTAAWGWTCLPGAVNTYQPLLRQQSQKNSAVVWLGTNDIGSGGVTAQFVGNALCGYAQTMVVQQPVHFNPFLVTMISRTGLDSPGKDTLNPVLRTIWKTCGYVGLIDMAADPNLGADGANASATWFQGDHIHPTQGAIDNVETPAIQRAVNRYYGNTDFTQATTYASAAPAATAPTACSETTNTVTVTSTLNPPVGSSVWWTGATPAAYNTNAQGWYVLTTSASNFTFFHPTSGLGPCTVQGTVFTHQQQDVDQYQVLNFGAGNYQLETCIGYTGQRIYIQNINAASSTLAPWGSETIVGSATVTQNQIAILEAQLVSQSAGGCKWVRLQ